MPIIQHNDLASKRGFFSKVISRDVINTAVGANAFTIWEQIIPAGGYITPHTHDIEEAIIVLSGQLNFYLAEAEHLVSKNSTIFIPPNQLHSAKNLSKEDVKIIAVLESANPRVIYPDEKPSPVDWADNSVKEGDL